MINKIGNDTIQIKIDTFNTNKILIRNNIGEEIRIGFNNIDDVIEVLEKVKELF